MVDCYCDYSSPDFYSVKNVLSARKAHRCLECKGKIDAGEKYERVAGKWDGNFSTAKTCAHCVELRDYVLAHVPCFCWYHTDLLNGAIDCARDFNSEAPGFLFGAYRRLIRIEKHGGKIWR
jgi:hypothetical protein